MAGPFDAYQGSYNPGFQPAAQPDHKHGTFGALLSSAATNVLPTAAGVATFSAGAVPGAEFGTALGGPLGGALGGLLGGGITSFAGASAAEKAQNYVVGQLPESVTKGTAFDPKVQAEDQAAHPYATTIGSVLPQTLFLRPGFGPAALPAGASDIDRLLANRWVQAGTGAAIGGGVEAGSEYGQDGRIDPIKVGINAVLGAALNQETALGRMTGAAGKIAGKGIVSAIPKVTSFAASGGARAADIYSSAFVNMPADMREAMVAASVRAGTVGDRANVAQAQSSLNVGHPEDDISTPDERAGIHVTDHGSDVREASPLAPDPVGTGAHGDRLAAMEAWLGVAGRPADVPSPAPLPVEPKGGDLTSATVNAEGLGKNPHSSAEGYGQFTRSTWLDVYRRNFGGEGMSDAQILALRHDKDTGLKMTAIYGQENAAGLRRAGLEDSPGNLSLAHFLGLGGARDVLRAGAETPIESVLPEKVIAANEHVLRGKTAGDVIEWAHKRIGNATGQPVARGDAVPQWDPETDVLPDGAPPIQTASFKPDEIETDAGLMQYKSGGDENGVTDRLRGVDQWNPVYSGKSIVWEGNDGRRVIVDGHQRLGLAQRLYPDDPNIRIDAMVMREADGVSPQMARTIGALKNIAEGSGDAVDAARILRDAPPGLDLPRVGDTLAAQAHGLASLSNEAFGAVLNNVIDPAHASRIGRILPDRPSQHMAMVGLLHAAKPRSAAEAETIVRQASADGFGASNEEQLGMFGDEPQSSLYGPAARVLEGAKRTLRNEKATFSTLAKDASRIEGAGNVLDRDANKARVQGNEQAIAIIEAAAHTSGPVRTALLTAARRSLAGDHAGAVREFTDAARDFNLKDVAAGMGDGGTDGAVRDEPGFSFDDPQTNSELADGRGVPRGTTPYDDAVSAQQHTAGFSEPAEGAAVTRQVQSLEHDLVMDAPEGSFRLNDEGDEKTVPEILKEADADLAAVDKARACLVPPAPKGETA